MRYKMGRTTALRDAVVAMAREVGLPAIADGSIDFPGMEGDLTISGLGPRSLVVDVKSIVPWGDPKAAKERKEAKNETDYKQLCAGRT